MLTFFSKNAKNKELINNLKKLEKKNNEFLQLTANENILSNTASQFASSGLAGRYYFGGGNNGVVKKRALDAIGLKEIEALIEAASSAANKKLNAKLVSFDLLSGLHAMIATMLSVSEPQDTIMTLSNKHGGHFMTNSLFARIGRQQIYTVHNPDCGSIDVLKTVEMYKQMNAKILYLDMMSLIEKIPLKQLRNGLGPEAIIIYDASHTLGLIIGGQFQDPLKEGADIIVGNTHKTFPGPQKAIIGFKDEIFGQKILDIMRRGLYSSVHTANIIALAITMLEMEEFGREYALQIISNANTLGSELEKRGYSLKKTSQGQFSQNHQLHVLSESVSDIKKIGYALYKNNISFNILNPPEGNSYLRLGTQEVTRRGMKAGEMKAIAGLLDDSLRGKNVQKKVIELNRQFSAVGYSFDNAF